MNTKNPLILSIDDDPECRRLIKTFLTAADYDVITANDVETAKTIIDAEKPDLILLDILMPGMSGYDFCIKFRKEEQTGYHPPIVFLSALEEVEDRAKAFQAGASDYIEKPIKKQTLLDKVWINLSRSFEWSQVEDGNVTLGQVLSNDYYDKFKEFLETQLNFNDDVIDKIHKNEFAEPYDLAEMINVNNRHMAQYIAAFMQLKYLQVIVPETIKTDVIGAQFCKTNLVIPIRGESDFGVDFVLSNPFNWELIDVLDQMVQGDSYRIFIIEPQIILTFFSDRKKTGFKGTEVIFDINLEEEINDDVIYGPLEVEELDVESSIHSNPVKYIANKIIYKAVVERASDIHIEAKQDSSAVRFRVDGELLDILTVKKATGSMVLNHFKTVGGLDIAEKLLPQDGSVDTKVGDRSFRLRLATTSTPDGESMIIRMLEPHAKVLQLESLGMTHAQRQKIVDLAKTPSGLVLVVGPTGSGKTTTIYSLIGMVDCHSRSLCSVEDPVEYRIPYANQQQINLKRGVTFETLLKSIVRQDPDVLFLGETRDNYTAKMAIDFSSTGHLTLTTMHTKNSVAALFRLERLGVDRAAMADAIIGIVAQRLIRKPCPYCKEIVNISNEEIELLEPFTDDIPSEVVTVNGCLKCNNTGYYGREGVYEILTITPEIARKIRDGVSVLGIRDFLRKKGEYLVVDHALEKVRDKIFTVKDAYQYVLREEREQVIESRSDMQGEVKIEDFANLEQNTPTLESQLPIPAPIIEPVVKEVAPEQQNHSSEITNKVESKTKTNKSILLIDDDINIRNLLQHFIAKMGYEVNTADDGVGALIALGDATFDLIISDVNMPNLDGFKLLKIMRQQKIDIPLIFLTSRNEEACETEGLILGAADYIVKPIRFPVLKLRIKKILGEL